MKYLKLYENYDIQIDNYVIANSNFASPKTQDFFKHNIGKIINVGNWCQVEYDYEIIPDDVILEDNSYWFSNKEIIIQSPNKQDCEAYLAANKYNL